MVAGDLNKKRKFILAAVFIIAICLRMAMSLYYFDISGDKIYQTAAAKSITLGNGYTIPSVNPLNLDQVLNKPMILWPPLYSIMLAPLMELTGETSTASFILDSLTNIVFLVLIYQVCLLLNFPFWLSLLVLVFRATEINEIITASTATDYMALNFWLAAIITAVRFLKKPQWITALIFILLNALAPWLRYASIPLVLVLPLMIFIVGMWKNEKRYRKMAMISGIAAIASTVLLLFYNYSRSGNFFYVLETKKGFFPENLLYLPPIAWTSIVNVNFPLTQISLRTGIFYGDLNIGLKLTSALILILLFYYVLKNANWKSVKENPNYFFILVSALAIANIGSLALLSITRSRNYQIDRFWTYIEDHRYMLVVTTALMFYLVHEFVVKRKTNIIGYLLVFLMIAESAHGVWVMAKRPLAPPGDISFNSGSPLTKDLLIKRNAAAAELNKELILIDEDYDLRGFAILNNISTMDDPADLGRTLYTSTKGKRLFFRMAIGHESLYNVFMSQPGVHEISRMEKAVFYELDIQPVK
jgi:hypothetical protein